MRKIKQFYYKIFPRYKVVETKFVTWDEGDKMIKETQNSPDNEKWVISEKEDENRIIGMVHLCRKERLIN